ncbi:acetolactate synthase large subunit [Thiomicrospira sp. ALE5]|uniref:acetolactate synthase large subunit n=1 Tax=Thiomicrospira sp. ALE5 TaxID=748650 RepID=UPI0008E173C6|nr:acetolactate synthase large subunit [Thiomicrospira sp. ALE5]SFR52353.1 acetolactate synthase-1/2/3 large subunit [Thiomicrospira sp. ALE5]
MNAAELLVKCLENEGVEYIFGIPGEENLDIMDALLDSPIQFILTRHEQGGAFMADVYGRLTGKAGVCLSTLGPGATNLVTGVADANMDHAPVVAIAGQASTTRLHKESHQVLDLVNLFQPITKYSTQILSPEIVPEVVRKAFKVAQMEKPGCSFIDFPENIAPMPVNKLPLKPQAPKAPFPHPNKIAQAVELISQARYPIILAGNGIVRNNASVALAKFAESHQIPVTNTFMAKGILPCRHPLALGTIGLQARDYIACGIDRADVIICIGYDIVEYHPHLWNHNPDCHIIHLDSQPAEVDEFYSLAVGVVADLNESLNQLCQQVNRTHITDVSPIKRLIDNELSQYADDASFPVKPQKAIYDLRQALDDQDIVICDVGAHKMWMARLYPAQAPNTCIISNGFASMGIALPGAMAAKLAHPERKVVALTGDAGFLMNIQEIETAVRLQLDMVVLIWNDSGYGLIKWKQLNEFGRESNIAFNNPDFVKLADAFGATGLQVSENFSLEQALESALMTQGVVIIDCPVDYSENLKLTERLGQLVCPT